MLSDPYLEITSEANRKYMYRLGIWLFKCWRSPPAFCKSTGREREVPLTGEVMAVLLRVKYGYSRVMHPAHGSLEAPVEGWIFAPQYFITYRPGGLQWSPGLCIVWVRTWRGCMGTVMPITVLRDLTVYILRPPPLTLALFKEKTKSTISTRTIILKT